MFRVWDLGSKLLKGGHIGNYTIIWGNVIEVIKGDNRSFDYSPDVDRI